MNQACAENFICFLSSYLPNEVGKYYCPHFSDEVAKAWRFLVKD